MNIAGKSKLVEVFLFTICVGGLLMPATAQSQVIKHYISVGTDNISNPDIGDTSTNQSHGLLCIKKASLPQPIGVPTPNPTGVSTDLWSEGYIFVVPNIQGNLLTSRIVADNRCRNYGISKYGAAFGSGFKMAEFHDGGQSGTIKPTSFWGDATFVASSNVVNPNFPGFNDRLWVSINDRNSNPWGIYNQPNFCGIPRALTLVKLKRIYCLESSSGSVNCAAAQ
jgi:hypothetical protein